MVVREAVIAIAVGIAFLFSLWVGINDKDYDKRYRVKVDKPVKEMYLDGKYLQRAGIRERYMEVEFWHLGTVQEWSKKLAEIKFPNAEIRTMFGVYQIKIDGEWFNIACSANGKYLYVGWELTERQKEKYREENGYYRDNRNKEEGHISIFQTCPKSL